MEEVNSKNTFKNFIFCLLLAFFLTFIAFLIFGILLSSTNLSEDTINPTIIIITAVSILLTSSVLGITLKKRGMIYGGILAGVYTVLLYILSSIVSKDFSININSIYMIISAIFAGMIGGIIGVNLRR